MIEYAITPAITLHAIRQVNAQVVCLHMTVEKLGEDAFGKRQIIHAFR